MPEEEEEEPLKDYRYLYVPQVLTFQNSTLLSHAFCVFLYGSQNKQQILPYRTLNDWFL